MVNSKGKILNFIGIFIVIFGIIGSIIFGAVLSSNAYKWSAILIGIISSLIFGMIFIGFGEIINLLQTNIYVNNAVLDQLKRHYENDVKIDKNVYWENHKSERIDIENKISSYNLELNKLSLNKEKLEDELKNINSFAEEKTPAERSLYQIDTELNELINLASEEALGDTKKNYELKIRALQKKQSDTSKIAIEQREKVEKIAEEKRRKIKVALTSISENRNSILSSLDGLKSKLENPYD